MTLRMSLFAALAAFGFGCAATGAAAATVPSCEAAAVRAEKAAGIPSFLLAAISRTETGHTRAGRGYGAWPWTLNIRGKGYYFETREDALAALQQAINAGETSVDVGCMQINYRWHGEQFSSIDQMIDPGVNTAYAAQFLSGLKKRLGSWQEATRHYHSATPNLGEAYLSRVQKVMAGFGQSPDLGPDIQVADAAGAADPNAPRRPRAPMIGISGAPLVHGGRSLIASGTAILPKDNRNVILSTPDVNTGDDARIETLAEMKASVRAAFGY